MKPILYGHPFSSYCQKVLIALYENEVEFDFRVLGPAAPEIAAELAALWPLQRFPVLAEDGATIVESTSIIEHLDLRHPGRTPLVPAEPRQAIEARMIDRVFDHHVMTPMQTLVSDRLRPEDRRDSFGVEQARLSLGRAYAWIDARMADRAWALSDFGLADCAAGPSLFYADWAHEIPDTLVHLRAYRARLIARPSFARAIAEARPFRPLFPLGAPDRD